MAARIKVTSEPKGSNPGGECVVYENDIKPFSGYFKYCNSSRVPKGSMLAVRNQPIYEAMTLQLARKLGLKTVDSYVLLNQNRDVVFYDWKKSGMKKDPFGRDFYFVSKLVSRGSQDTKEDSAEISKLLTLDEVYLESLLIDDIMNKRQNYLFDRKNVNKIKYIDVGCSFVRAVNGVISLPRSLKRLSSKRAKRMAKGLREVNIISADNSNFLNLEDLAESVPKLKIPTLNPVGSVSIDNFLFPSEIEEIYGYILQGLTSAISKFDERKLSENGQSSIL